MNEFFNNHHEDELFGLKEFLDRKYRILMEKIANSSVLPPDAIDIAPKSRAPFRFISFDAQKNKRSPMKIRTTIDSKYSEIFKDISSLANDYADASRKALHLNNIADARMFIDEAMRLLTDFEVDVPEEFVNLNTEILAKLPTD